MRLHATHAKALLFSALLLLLAAPAAQAGKVPGFGVLGTGTTGTGAGQLGVQPRGVAVNTTGAGGASAGDVYVGDGTNRRVNQYSGSGTFIRSFGHDVIASGPGNDSSGEVQSLRVVATEGTFTLTFSGQTTGALASDVPASGGVGPTVSVQNALEALPNIGVGQVTVTGGPGDGTGSSPYIVTFGGTLGGVDVAQITIGAGRLGIPAGTQLSCAGSGQFDPEITYQWLADGEPLGAANGAQTPTYTVQPGDAGKVIQCRAKAERTGDATASLQASPPSVAGQIVAAPYPATAPPTTTQTSLAVPAVVGGGNLTAAGKKLTCAAGSWTGAPTFSYQWYRNGVALAGNGADTTEYTVQPDDVSTAAVFQCAVTASNAGGKATLFSANRNTAPPLPGSPLAPPQASASAPHPANSATISEASGPEVCNAGIDTCQAGSNNAAAGALAGIQGLAIDPDTGNVFVTSNTNRRIDVYSATGEFQGAFGWAVDASAPEEALQFCTEASGCLAGSGGPAAGQFGSLSGAGGQGSIPAISPANGHLYVPQPGNRRIEEFSLTHNGSDEVTDAAFVRAFGGDVVPTINETQTVTLSNTTGGAFSLSFKSQATGGVGTGNLKAGSGEVTGLKKSGGTFLTGERLSGPGIPAGAVITAVTFDSINFTGAATESRTASAIASALPFDAGSGLVQEALSALPSVGKGNVSVTGADGGPWTVELAGPLAGADQPALGGDASDLTGASPAIDVVTVRDGANGTGTGLEACTAATTCQAGSGNGSAGSFTANTPASLAIDSTGAVYATGQPLGRVHRFDALGATSEEFASAQLSSPSFGGNLDGVTPKLVTVDPANDHVLVAKRQSTTSFKIFEFTRAGGFIDVSPPGETGLASQVIANGTNGPPGLAVGTADRAYLAIIGNNPLGTPVRILGNPPAPEAEIDPASAIGQTSATFNGVATPSAPGIEGGFPTAAYFEYSSDGVTWTASEPVELGDGQGAGDPNACPAGNPPACNVSLTVTGLTPATGYAARLVVSNGTRAVSSPVSFTTGGAAPSVSGLRANPVSAGSATLTARVNPNNKATTYYFEWGTDASYGTRIPADFDVVAGSGAQPVPAAGNLTGLQPATTYHFRLVAKSSGGTTVSRDQRFQTLNPASLPANRGIELVSPPDKQPAGGVNSDIISAGLIGYQAAEDGSSIAYPILNGLAGNDSGGMVLHMGRRTPSGWLSSQVSPESLLPSLESGDATNPHARPGNVTYYSPEDMSCALLESHNPLTDDTPAAAAAAGVTNLYRWNGAHGDYTLVTRRMPENPAAEKPFADAYYRIAGATPDCSRIFFRSTAYTFLPGASGLYEWDNGTLRDAGILPNDSPAASGVNASVVGEKHAVSPDGRFFFTATSSEAPDAGKAAIFVRDGVGDTVNASKPETATPTLGARYEVASPDGSRVFFVANYGLTAVSSSGPSENCINKENFTQACALYMYDVEAEELTDISADSNPADSKGAVVNGVIDVSDDGSTVYFAARGQLIPGQGRTYNQNLQGSGFMSIYRWHEGELSYVAPLSVNDAQGGGLINVPHLWNAQTTKSGSHLLFESSQNITGFDSGGVRQAYLYSDEAGEVECLSCPAGSPKSEGPLLLQRSRSNPGVATYSPRSLSDDGRAFFSTLEALTPDATQGTDAKTETNIYEWHDGQVALLASGRVSMIDISADGQDVFIRAYDQLDSHDVDFAPDLYSLRIGGGFPAEAEPPAPCDAVAGGCQGDASPPPAAAVPPSSTFTGPGNPPARPGKATKRAKKAKKKAKRRKARQGKRKAKQRQRKRKQARRANKINRGGAK